MADARHDMTSQSLLAVAETWRPSPSVTTAVLRPEPATMFLRVLDEAAELSEGDELPPMWHWLHFTPVVRQQDLGEDGHPRSGHFLPPLNPRRRMMAGGSLRSFRPFIVGERYDRKTELDDIALKSGSAGELLFVRLRHTFHDANGPLAIETEQAVYRDPAQPSASTSAGNPAPPSRTATMEDHPSAQTDPLLRIATDPTLLFRFSALTHNAHRIHYDLPYSTGVEGHPGLVVHGPLIALSMLELARRYAPSRQVTGFDYRLRAPLHSGQPIVATASVTDDTWAATVHGAGAAQPTATGVIQFG